MLILHTYINHILQTCMHMWINIYIYIHIYIYIILYIYIYRYIMSMYVEATSLKPGLVCRGSNMFAAPVHMPVMTIKGQCPTKEAAQARLFCVEKVESSWVTIQWPYMAILISYIMRNTHKHMYIYIYMCTCKKSIINLYIHTITYMHT